MRREGYYHRKCENRRGALGTGVTVFGGIARRRLKAPKSKRLLLLLLALFSLGVYGLQAEGRQKIDERWCALLLEGRTVGYLHQSTWGSADGLMRSEIEQTMEILRFGVPFTLSQRDAWIEHPQRGLISLSSETDMNGQLQRVDARAQQGDVEVTVACGADRQSFVLEADGPIGIYEADRRLTEAIREWSSGAERASVEVSYHLFSPETFKIEQVDLRIIGEGELEDSRGLTHRGLVIEERSSSLPGVVTTEIYGEQARFLYARTPVGLALEILRIDAEPKAKAPELFDVAALTIAVSGLEELKRPLAAVEAVTIRFHGRGAAILKRATASAERDLDAGAGRAGAKRNLYARIVSASTDARAADAQLVQRLTDPALRDTAETDRGFPAYGHEPPAEAKAYLRAGFHLDLDDPRLERLAEDCAIPLSTRRAGKPSGSEISMVAPEQLECLERSVYRYIRTKSLDYGFADLQQILSSRSGDCTEHALLLAAVLRRIGIPARLAYGLILTEIGFIGHAWTEMFAGDHWIWLDSSFPEPRDYGMKIRLGVMDPAQPYWADLGLDLLRVTAGVRAEILEVEYR